eukprot:1090309-Rhodomonas_salina.1
MQRNTNTHIYTHIDTSEHTQHTDKSTDKPDTGHVPRGRKAHALPESKQTGLVQPARTSLRRALSRPSSAPSRQPRDG